MPSVPPTSANDYQAPPAPAKLVVDRAVWNSVFGSVGSRLRELEDVNSGIEVLKLELQNFGIQRLDEAINPLIEQTQQSLATLQAAVATAQQELSDTVEDANAAFAAALATASQSIADLQETLDQMLAGGVPAANVAITAIEGLAATDSQAAFAELVADLDALADSLADALNLKADASALAAVAAGLGSVITANTQAVGGGEYYVKTAGGAVTVTLPLNPANGNIVTIWRYGANVVTIARNGKTINFVADDIQIDADRAFVQLKHFDGNWSAIPGKF